MAVPAHDSRDYAFAKHFNLPIVPLVEGCDVSEETVRADVVTAVHFTGTGFNGGSRVGQEVVSTVIAALAGGFLILLNSHFLNTPRGLKVNF